ncbi:hypothetical protein TI05_18445 [Achromatium sp. WMS3]|nr:hypothetical protein TI05_18445 [Achromatium sp. WMS3]
MTRVGERQGNNSRLASAAIKGAVARDFFFGYTAILENSNIIIFLNHDSLDFLDYHDELILVI